MGETASNPGSHYTLNGIGPVIVVDDVGSDLKIFEVFYKKSKIKNPLLNFLSGTDLLDYLDKVESGNAEMPALVFLDINMPKLNGHETLAKMRGRKSFESLPAVVMLTSSTREEDRKKASEAGAMGYFVKPLDGSEYLQLFNTLIP